MNLCLPVILEHLREPHEEPDAVTKHASLSPRLTFLIFFVKLLGFLLIGLGCFATGSLLLAIFTLQEVIVRLEDILAVTLPLASRAQLT